MSESNAPLGEGSTIPTPWRLSAHCRALHKQSGSACSTLTQFEFGPLLVVFLTEILRVLPLTKRAAILQFRLKIFALAARPHRFSSWLVVFRLIGLEPKSVADSCQKACCQRCSHRQRNSQRQIHQQPSPSCAPASLTCCLALMRTNTSRSWSFNPLLSELLINERKN